MKPEVDNDRVTVYRTTVGLLTVPKAQGKSGPHAVASRVNGVLAEVVAANDAMESLTAQSVGNARYMLAGARSAVARLGTEIDTMRAKEAPADLVNAVEVAQREMASNLRKVESRIAAFPS